jgi:hypothetical protein
MTMEPLWADGEFVLCSMDALCENCQHPMRGHFRETHPGYGTGCHACACDHWCCRHGGQRIAMRGVAG